MKLCKKSASRSHRPVYATLVCRSVLFALASALPVYLWGPSTAKAQVFSCTGTDVLTCSGRTNSDLVLGLDQGLILETSSPSSQIEATVSLTDGGTSHITLQYDSSGSPSSIDRIYLYDADLVLVTDGRSLVGSGSAVAVHQDRGSTGRVMITQGGNVSDTGSKGGIYSFTADAINIGGNRADHVITNSGQIFSRSGRAIYFERGGGTITNNLEGTITSESDTAIRSFNGPLTITNRGLIETDSTTTIFAGVIEASLPLYSYNNDDIIMNAGIIRRNDGGSAIELRFGDDKLIIETGSTIEGSVDGGVDTDTLSFAGSGADSFDLNDIGAGQQYVNFEDFEVAGGEWTFSGTTTQNFTQSGGTIKGDGTFGAFTANSGSSITGNGTFGALTANNGARIAPGNSIGTINTGDLHLVAGSTLVIEVTQTAADQVNVTGAVTIDNGAILQVDDLAPALEDAAQTFIIINNDGADVVTGTFGSIVDNMVFLTPHVTTSGGDGNDIELSFTLHEFSTLASETQNQRNVGFALDDLDSTSGSKGDALRRLILPLSNDQALQTYTGLSGNIHPSNSHTLFDVGGNVGGQIGSRFSNLGGGGAGTGGSNDGFGYSAALDTLNSNSTSGSYFSTDLATQETKEGEQEFGYGYTPAGLNSDEALQLWGGISGYYANVEGDGNAQGTTSSGFGAVFGGDKTVGTSTWGAAFGYAKTTTLTHDGLSNLGMNSFTGSVYTQQELGDFTINGLAAYTYHKIDGNRTISNINAAALSDYHAHQAIIQGEIARKFIYDHNKDITPYVLGRYMNIATSAYTETGAGAANLVSNGENYWSLDLVLGARMDIELDKDTKLTFGGGYSHRFGDNSPEATFAFSGGGNFTTTGVERNRHSAFFEVGFEKSFSDNAKFFASANANLTDTHQSIGGNVGFKIRF